MFYCAECAERKKWPESWHTSHGRCEICGRTAVCNDVASSQLPDPSPERE